jgi:glycosyltransferase involved in cell wall biosynthesis
MKLLVVSHPCVLPLNQEFYAAVEKITGWSLSLIIPAAWNNEYQKQIVPSRSEDLKGEIHYIPCWNAGNIPLHLYKSWLVSLFKRERPNAIYVHHEPYGLATAQVYLANRWATSCAIGFYAAQNIAKTFPLPIRILEKYVLSQSRFCFPVNKDALNVVTEKGFCGIGQVLPPALNNKMYYPQESEAAKIRCSLHVDRGTFVIGYLGRLVEEKGLRSMVRALTLIRNEPWSCVIAGAGPLGVQLQEDVLSAGLSSRVHFVGYVPHEDAPKWLSAFDVLVLPSETRSNWKEQFGRVLVEANACGTPVIGSTCGEIPAVIRCTGGGLVVPEADPRALANTLTELIRDRTKLRVLAERGRRGVAAEFDLSYLASNFARVVESAATESRCSGPGSG